jgi:large subunit ribosomal protein L30
MKIAIVQIRGMLKVRPKVKTTLKLLNLPKKHSCVVVEITPALKGMLLVLKDYIAWGELDAATTKLLLEKRGKIAGGKKLTEEYLQLKVNKSIDQFANDLTEDKIKIKDVPGMKAYFRLNPPKGGFERKGIKQPFATGGVLGYRGAKINDLIQRML